MKLRIFDQLFNLCTEQERRGVIYGNKFREKLLAKNKFLKINWVLGEVPGNFYEIRIIAFSSLYKTKYCFALVGVAL